MSLSSAKYLSRIISNWYSDYLELTVITSRTKGKLASVQRPFGVGKSSLAWQLSYMLYYIAEYGEKSLAEMTLFDDGVWNKVFDHATYTIDGVIELLTYTDERLPCILWDDAQLTAPAITNISKELKQKIEYLSTARDSVANIIMTAPNISELAKPLRKIVSYELIVPERGRYEVQHVVRRKNFYAPTKDFERLLYLGQGQFPKLPPEVDARYKKWRLYNRKMFGASVLRPKKIALSPA